MIEKAPLISFKHITKSFKKNSVLEDLNLEIYQHEIIGLLGRSGCGKSTLLKILIGFYLPDRGMILYEGDNLVRENEKIRNIAGFVSQENSFYEKLTVEENLKFFAKLYHVPSSEIDTRISHLLDLVYLNNARDTLSSKISGGMKRRLEFAISLIHDPKLLILDEPFTGLDISIRDQLWSVVKKIKSSGVTVIICTHLLESAQKNCDRIVVLHNKKINKDIDLNENKRDPNYYNLEKEFLEATR